MKRSTEGGATQKHLKTSPATNASVELSKEAKEPKELKDSKESKEPKELRASPSRPSHRFNVELDLFAITLFVLSFGVRFYRLGYPRSVVFDEYFTVVHVGHYFNRTFYFEPNPPLGKLLISLAAWFTSFDYDQAIQTTGQEYSPNTSVAALRFFPALSGALLPLIVYYISSEIGVSTLFSFVAGLLVAFDNALIVHSRIAVVDLMGICTSMAAFLATAKLCKKSTKPFTKEWFLAMICVGVAEGLTISITRRCNGTLLLCWVLLLPNFWQSVKTFPLRRLAINALMTNSMLIGLPLVIYIGSFWIHLTILNRSGAQIAMMSSEFQLSLEGEFAWAVRGQPEYIAYGSQIILRNSHGFEGKPCWLHSHFEVYPIRYDHERGSSHQQQITCYSFKDVNNWWIIKDPNRNNMLLDDPIRLIKHGDVIELVHGTTARLLNSHDVAAPRSPYDMEVTGYIDYNVSQPMYSRWKVEIVNSDQVGLYWKTVWSRIKLIHVQTKGSLRVTGELLPDWGFHQLEVSNTKMKISPQSIWHVEENRYPQANSTEDDNEQKEAFVPAQINFFHKFLEIMMKVSGAPSQWDQPHKSSCTVRDLLLGNVNIPYWTNESNCQIHLLSNVWCWASGLISLVVSFTFFIIHQLRRQRKLFDIPERKWNVFDDSCNFAIMGYTLNLAAYLSADHHLFLFHYLPALPFKLMSIAFLMDHISVLVHHYTKIGFLRHLLYPLLLSWAFGASLVFVDLLPLTYGTPCLNGQQLLARLYRPNWELFIE